jgi:hypothetical protein
MVEAAGIEGSRNFAVVRGGAWTLMMMHSAFCRLRTTTHVNEFFCPVLSRPRNGAGGGSLAAAGVG